MSPARLGGGASRSARAGRASRLTWLVSNWLRPVRRYATSKRPRSRSHGRSSQGLAWWPRTTRTRGRRASSVMIGGAVLQSSAVRIGIEAWAAADVPAGRGRYLRELLRALDAIDHPHELVLLTRRPWDQLPATPRRRWVAVAGSGPRWLVGAARAARRRCDVLLATTSYALPALARLPSATVVYDRVSFDTSYGTPAGSRLERLTLPLAVRRTQRLICISEETRRELVARYPAAADRTVVTLLAA